MTSLTPDAVVSLQHEVARFPIGDDVILFRSGEGIKAVVDQRGMVVLTLLDGDHTVAQVVDELTETYEGADRATIEADVLAMLSELDDEDLLDVLPLDSR